MEAHNKGREGGGGSGWGGEGGEGGEGPAKGGPSKLPRGAKSMGEGEGTRAGLNLATQARGEGEQANSQEMDIR